MRWTNLCGCVLLGLAIAGCGDNSSTTAPNTVATTGTLSKADVEKLISDATSYIAANEWDLADKGITTLEGKKSKFPEYASKIDELRKNYNTAKAAAAKMPAGMTMPKVP